MDEAALSDVLRWPPSRICEDAAALSRLVHAAVAEPLPQRRQVLEKLLQVVEQPVDPQVCQALSAALVVLLSRTDADSRYVAARLVRDAGEVPAARAPLLRGLGADEKKVREACLDALWRFDLSPEDLVPALRSKWPEERAAALRRVNGFPNKQPLDAELKRMLADPVASLRHQAALLREDDARDERQWELLLELARTGREEWRRCLALERLITWGPREESLRQLIEGLKTDPDAGTRATCALSLQRLAPSRPEVVQALLASLRDVSPSVGREAAAALDQCGACSEVVIPGLWAALEDLNLSEEVRGRAAITLGRLGAVSVVPLLTRMLEQPDARFGNLDEVTGLRGLTRPMKVDLVEALNALGPLAREAVPILLRCVRLDRGLHQVEAAQVVERLGTAPEELERALCVALPETQGPLRKRLREVLSRLAPASEGALRELVLALVDDGGMDEEDLPARGLRRTIDIRPEHLARIAALTREEDPRMRRAANRALDILGPPTAEDP